MSREVSSRASARRRVLTSQFPFLFFFLFVALPWNFTWLLQLCATALLRFDFVVLCALSKCTVVSRAFTGKAFHTIAHEFKRGFAQLTQPVVCVATTYIRNVLLLAAWISEGSVSHMAGICWNFIFLFYLLPYFQRACARLYLLIRFSERITHPRPLPFFMQRL